MRRLYPLCLLLALAAAASAADVSTYSFNSGMNCGGNWPIPDTGQSTNYTGTFGEDQDYQPARSQMSYAQYTSTAVDNRTGLVWIRDPGAAGLGAVEWQWAVSACAGLTYAGASDWRLPNIKELMSIVDYGKTTAPRINSTVFSGVSSSKYWSSTANWLGYPSVIDFNTGEMVMENLPLCAFFPPCPSNYTICVRGRY